MGSLTLHCSLDADIQTHNQLVLHDHNKKFIVYSSQPSQFRVTIMNSLKTFIFIHFESWPRYFYNRAQVPYLPTKISKIYPDIPNIVQFWTETNNLTFWKLFIFKYCSRNSGTAKMITDRELIRTNSSLTLCQIYHITVTNKRHVIIANMHTVAVQSR